MSLFDNLRKNIAVIALVLIYIVADMIMISHEIYYQNLLPIVLAVIFLALVRIDILYFIIVFLTPLSIPLIEYIPSSPIDFAIPTEPLLFGVMVIFIYKLVREKGFDARIINHPVSYAIFFYLFWLFVTFITSSMPLVSFKFMLARTWFLITFYFLAITIFRKTSNIQVFVWCYVIPMVIVVIYSIYRHLGYGLFDKQAAHFVMNPFFRDHTSYGAILAMLFFAIGGLILRYGHNIVLRFFNWSTLAVITTGLVLSYTRAAWISVFLALGVMILTLLKIKFRYIVIIGTLIIMYFLGQRVEILHKLERNKQESSANLSEHVKSISNIRSDDSNMERLNKWNAAFRMFKERPVFGWGPGTYMFKYAPFQLSKNKTLISTDFGNLGNAHSEYIGPLAEAGVLGTLSFVLIIVLSLITGFKVYHKIEDERLKQLVLAFILGLITYIIHGSVNNFLDTDKASALFWGFIAVFVSLDIYHLPHQKTEFR